MIAFWTGPDPDRIDRIFRLSAICDAKWEERADYRTMTINKALTAGREFYTDRNAQLVTRRKIRLRKPGGGAVTQTDIPDGSENPGVVQ
jgi:hypothetical protein